MKWKRASHGALVVAATAVVAACGAPAVTYAGHDVKDVTTFLASLEKQFRSEVTAGGQPANVAAGAHCYLATTGEQHAVAGQAFCGPVLHQFGDASKPWDAYTLVYGGDADSPTLGVKGHATTGVQLPAGTSFVGPDGGAPPKSTAGLTVPPPPELEAGTVQSLSSETGDKLQAIADGRLIGYSADFRERGVATLDVVGRGTEQRRAASGQKLLLVRYDWSGSEATPTWTYGGTTTGGDGKALLTLVVDGARTSLDDVVQTGEGKLMVLSVPASASSVQLEFGQYGVEQHLDLRTGQRDTDAPAVLYRSAAATQSQDDTTGVVATVNQEFSLPFQRGDMFDGTYPTTVIVKAMDLEYWVSTTKHASAPDKALLRFDVQTGGGNTWYGAVDPNRVVLKADDGTTYQAQTDNKDDDYNLINDRYWFEVPATFTGGTVTITPGVVHQTQSGFFAGADLDYKTSSAQFTVRMP